MQVFLYSSINIASRTLIIENDNDDILILIAATVAIVKCVSNAVKIDTIADSVEPTQPGCIDAPISMEDR
jgi:hypothetical protein